MNVDCGPLPRTVTPTADAMFMNVLAAAKYPLPSSTYVPLGQEAIAVLITDTDTGDADVPPAIVEPHCVRVGGVHGFGVVSPSGSVAGSPALVQFVARPEERMLDHGCCAWVNPENKSDSPKGMDK